MGKVCFLGWVVKEQPLAKRQKNRAKEHVPGPVFRSLGESNTDYFFLGFATPFTVSARALPGLNLATFLGAIFMALPV